ncbi:MAG: histidinol-phosphate transaminase [Usitatibacter sp.]
MSKRPADLVRPEILAAQAYHVAPAQGMVKLDAMENPYPLPAKLAGEMAARLARVAINRYPDPSYTLLKQRLREALAIPAGLDLVLGNGSDEIILMLSMALARPDAVTLAPEPSFVMYRVSAVAAGMRFVGVPLREDFTLDEARFLAAIEQHRPALTWLAYPNNPTGNLFAREAILRIVAASPGLVVADEAYFPFSGGASMASEVGKHPNLVLVRTVSKLGLAGLRLGLAAGPADWMAELEKVRPPYNINVLTAAAAEFLLGHHALFEEQARALVAERAVLERGLDAIARVRRFPSAANFVLARVPDAPKAFDALKSRGILVKNLHGSHPLLANCLRLTVGTSDENAKLLEALSSILGPQNA